MTLNLKIDLAKGCGFCFGVRKALQKAEEALKENEHIYMLGDIVHNETVVEDLSKKGAIVVDSLENVNDYPLLFRAHGTEAHVITESIDNSLTSIDATCPLVKLIHDEIKELAEEGRQVLRLSMRAV